MHRNLENLMYNYSYHSMAKIFIWYCYITEDQKKYVHNR